MKTKSDRSNRNLCNLVNDVTLGYVVHTIVPETIRFTKHYQREAYKNLSCIVLVTPGSISLRKR